MNKTNVATLLQDYGGIIALVVATYWAFAKAPPAEVSDTGEEGLTPALSNPR